MKGRNKLPGREDSGFRGGGGSGYEKGRVRLPGYRWEKEKRRVQGRSSIGIGAKKRSRGGKMNRV